MHPRQVQQYIGRKLGEFYGLLLTRRRSIVLSLEEDLNTTHKDQKIGDGKSTSLWYDI